MGTGGAGGGAGDARSWAGTGAVTLARVFMVGLGVLDAESQRDEADEARSWSSDNNGGSNMANR